MATNLKMAITKRLGPIIQANGAKVMFAFTVGLLILCVAIKSTKLDADLSSWIQKTDKVNMELQYVSAALGEGSGSNSILLLQTPKTEVELSNVLTVEALTLHLEALATAMHVTIDHFDETWSLKELCFKPTIPDFEDYLAYTMIDNITPCVIKTPLDCFWDGSKIFESQKPITLGSMAPQMKWSNLNPWALVENFQRNFPHASFPFETLIDWMRRVGITTGYQYKPCLDPTDKNCPHTAPNKFSNQPPDIGSWLTHGCRGFASNLFHWKEEEIVGGVTKNDTGHIIRASALQSTILLMDEHDFYDYYRKDQKIQDIKDWSVEKARAILEAWQNTFEENVAQITREQSSSKTYKIQAMTSNTMLRPIDLYSLMDLTTFELCLLLMTVYALISFPKFTRNESSIGDETNQSKSISISRGKTYLLVLVNASMVGLTFIASLGISSFMNIPFNLATTQILPPLALYYGFNQLILISNIYSKNLKESHLDDLTSDCLDELVPILERESATYIISLSVALLFPIEGTRVFALQAIIFILVCTLIAFLLVPSIMTTFILYHLDRERGRYHSKSNGSFSGYDLRISTRTKGGKFKLRKSEKSLECDSQENIEDQIFSRIQDDLKNIQADIRGQTDINFSARIGNIHTNFQLSSSQPERTQFSRTNQDRASQSDLGMPDLIQGVCSDPLGFKMSDEKVITKGPNFEEAKNSVHIDEYGSLKWLECYARCLTSNKYVQSIICSVAIMLIVAFFISAPRVKYGLQMMDITTRGTRDYESTSIQEKYFPVFNVFATTRGNFDYPNNQKLLHEYYESIEKIDGVVSDGKYRRFWLARFRDWLLDIQSSFDRDREESRIHEEGWAPEARRESRLAFKLLAQTGKVDNPVNKSLINTNRLVNDEGIINPKAFYYYLTAWIMNDPFTYSATEANLRPEPKIWHREEDNLKIEKAKPLTYAQIPFTMKISPVQDTMRTISEVRYKSEIFELRGLPNFPSGIPFVFWDQFLSLDLMTIATVIIIQTLLIVFNGLTAPDLRTNLIFTILEILTLMFLYCLLGYLAIPFNSVIAVLLISNTGTTTVQSVHFKTFFDQTPGDRVDRARRAVVRRFRPVVSSLGLFVMYILSYQCSRIDFIDKYSSVLVGLVCINTLKALLIAPVILSLFGSKFKQKEVEINFTSVKPEKRVPRKKEHKKRNPIGKKRNIQKFHSEISLSTISEEPQSESPQSHDFKIDVSIRC